VRISIPAAEGAGLTPREQRDRNDAKHRVGSCVGMGGGEYVPMYTTYLPQGGWCTQNEPFEKRPTKGEHMILGNVLPGELVGMSVPKK